MKKHQKRWLSLVLALLLVLSTCGCGVVKKKINNESIGENPSEPTRYGRTMLSEQEARIYDLLVSGIYRTDPKEVILLGGVKYETVHRAFGMFLADYPECFWLQNTYRYASLGDTLFAIMPNYLFLGEGLATARQALNDAVDELLGDLPTGADPYECTLYLHDALIQHVSYAKQGQYQTVYGALVEGYADCSGYAAAYQLLLGRAGISSLRIVGEAGNPNALEQAPTPHEWNAVWLDESTCVYTDVTWDDTQTDGDPLHAYFNLPLSEMEVDHTAPPELYPLPSCDHSGYTYFERTGLILGESPDVATLASFFGEVENGRRTAVFYYAGEQDFGEWFNAHTSEILDACGCKDSDRRCYYQKSGNEVHVTAEGSFYFRVSVSYSPYFSLEQGNLFRVALGDEIRIRCTVSQGYTIPLDYQVPAINGLTVTPIVTDGKMEELWIRGIPTADTEIILPFPTSN